MTKAELIKGIGTKVEGTTLKDIDAILKALAEVVEDVVKADDKVVLPGLGTFSVKEVPERRGTIMMGDRKGKEYIVPSHKEPKFKLTKAFKDVLL